MAAKHSDLINSILITLSKSNNIRCWRNETGAAMQGSRLIKFGLKGSSDIFAIAGPEGKFIAIECKIGRDKLNPAQEAFKAMVTRLGGIYIEARSVEQVEKELSQWVS